jgi:hypothetical protein
MIHRDKTTICILGQMDRQNAIKHHATMLFSSVYRRRILRLGHALQSLLYSMTSNRVNKILVDHAKIQKLQKMTYSISEIMVLEKQRFVRRQRIRQNSGCSPTTSQRIGDGVTLQL